MICAMATYSAAPVRRPVPHREPQSLEFPGCHPVRIPRDAIADYEGRLEYWDADTEIAMICEPVTVYHEHPPQRLAGLVGTIAHVRGAPIATLGAAALVVRDAHGAYQRILQADQTVYLHPRATRPEGPAIEVGSDTLPDVVLEVDNTTDVRRGKLALYESWGFPEVWVEVPDTASPSRPVGLRSGLTIHLLGERGYRTAPSSRAFPEWTAQEIHEALNEPESSAATVAVLRRVGRALGAAEGTGPDDDPLLRSERAESRAKGRAEGFAKARAEGFARGQAKGRAELLIEAVLQVFEARGLPVSEALPGRLAELERVSAAVLMQAALQCRDERHFLRLLSDRA